MDHLLIKREWVIVPQESIPASPFPIPVPVLINQFPIPVGLLIHYKYLRITIIIQHLHIRIIYFEDIIVKSIQNILYLE